MNITIVCCRAFCYPKISSIFRYLSRQSRGPDARPASRFTFHKWKCSWAAGLKILVTCFRLNAVAWCAGSVVELKCSNPPPPRAEWGCAPGDKWLLVRFISGAFVVSWQFCAYPFPSRSLSQLPPPTMRPRTLRHYLKISLITVSLGGSDKDVVAIRAHAELKHRCLPLWQTCWKLSSSLYRVPGERLMTDQSFYQDIKNTCIA